MTVNLTWVTERFPLPGTLVDARPYGSGHINETFALTLEQGGAITRFILQRINRRVFKDVPRLMDNIARVSGHLARKAPADPREVLTLVRTREGAACFADAAGECWRVYDFVERASSHDLLGDPRQAFEAALAYGRFQRLLADLPAPRLHDTIPDFHHTRQRFAMLQRAIAENRAGRRGEAAREIEFARAREAITDVLLALHAAGKIPERITHNDTKLNNVLLDDATGRGVCVIDLDTVMPGLSLYDFGDMVRSATNSAAEDETDLARVQMRLPVFEQLAAGFLAGTDGALNAAEVEHLAFAGRLITFEIGMRFLTDFLAGDVYFRTKRPNHNLDRARCQFALVASMEAQAETMAAIVARLAGR